MKIIGIIPARYGSIRFPGKPLAALAGKSMIQRVYEQACKARSLQKVIVATDDNRIFEHVEAFGGYVMLTSGKHSNGTERCAEVASKLKEKYDAVINIQGDEPFIRPLQIDLVAGCLKQQASIATLVKRIHSSEDYENPSVVKVVVNRKGQALYFSRATVPFVRNDGAKDIFKRNIFYKHIGIYGYRTAILKKITLLKPSPIEQIESLEQLRWLENGFTISVRETAHESQAIDTPEDLQKMLQTFKQLKR